MKEINSGNPLWLLLSLPVFFAVWWLLGIEYAYIFGPGALILLFVIKVWLPADQAKKLNRKAYFAEVRKILAEVFRKVVEIKDSELRNELGKKALVTFGSLVDGLFGAEKHQGLVEEKLLPSIGNLSKLVTKWIDHETHRHRLGGEEAEKLRRILMTVDDLFRKWQSGSVDDLETLTAEYELDNDISAAGVTDSRGEVK